MKKRKYLFTALLSIFLIASCYVDKGNYEYTLISDIVIGGIEENYSKISVVDTLKIIPNIVSSYNESDFEYLWTEYDSDNKCDTLSHERNLSYFLTKAPGTYTIYYYVKNKTNGYYVHTSTRLTVVTEYSQGHYILKETAGGDTDMDLLLDDGKVITDILLKTQGSTLSGAPRSMGLLYKRQLTDPGTLTKTNNNCIGIITYDKKVNILRTSDMRLIFSHSTMFYEAPDDIPYTFYTIYQVNGYLSSIGSYTTSVNSAGSGILGLPSGVTGGSDHWGMSTKTYGLIYWDEAGSRILYTNNNGVASAITDKNYPTSGLNYTCLFMGSYKTTVYGLFKDKSTSKLYLYKVTTTSVSKQPEIGSVTEIGTTSRLHTATLFASNERSAQLIYFVNNNKPYYYDVVNNVEYEMSATALPGDEAITYISNRFYRNSSPQFDYLTIATFKNGNYKVYMYNMVGGLPYGEAVRTTSGVGKVKETHYLTAADYSHFYDFMAGYGMDYGYSR